MKKRKPRKKRIIPTGATFPDGEGGDWREVNVVVNGKIIKQTVTLSPTPTKDDTTQKQP